MPTNSKSRLVEFHFGFEGKHLREVISKLDLLESPAWKGKVECGFDAVKIKMQKS